MIVSDLQLVRLLDIASFYAMSLIKGESIDENQVAHAREIDALVREIKYQQSDELKT